MDDIAVSRTISNWANQKPWLTGAVHWLLKAWNAAFIGDKIDLRTARTNLSRGIRSAKRRYSMKVADHFNNSKDTRNLRRGIQTITDYKPSPRTCKYSISMLNRLNDFFTGFEADNDTPAEKIPPSFKDQVLSLTPDKTKQQQKHKQQHS